MKPYLLIGRKARWEGGREEAPLRADQPHWLAPLPPERGRGGPSFPSPLGPKPELEEEEGKEDKTSQSPKKGEEEEEDGGRRLC